MKVLEGSEVVNRTL